MVATDPLSQWYRSLSVRVDLQADLGWSGLQDGYAQGGGQDVASPFQWLWWTLGPVKTEHCFPAGTLIATPDGERPIEAIQVGDLVNTLTGPRRVTRLYRSIYHGELARIAAGNCEVTCTPNHPFLTQRGWIAADDLRRGDQVVLAQNGGDFLATHVRLPDADHGVTARAQVGILSTVALLLRHLAFRQRLESGMAVPVVPIGLDDQFADADVHDEARLDERGRLEVNTQLGQYSAQSVLEFAGLVALDPLMSSEQLRLHGGDFLRMLSAPRFDLRHNLLALHRIVLGHMRAGLRVHDAMAGFLREHDLERVGLVADLHKRIAQRLGNFGGAVRSVVLSQIRDLLGRPHPAAGRSAAVGLANPPRWITTVAQIRIAIADMAAGRARLHLARSIRRPLLAAQIGVPAFDATEPASGVASPVLQERHSALTANELHRHSGLPPSIQIIPRSTLVYNLEVEGVHHYIANGFVVHNCDDCVNLALDGPYDPPGSGGHELFQTPGDGSTECGAGCKCSLEYGASDQPNAWAWASRLPKSWRDQWDGQSPPGVLAPAQSSDLTSDQKAALDVFRKASAAWDAARTKEMPSLPSLFGTGHMAMRSAAELPPSLTREQTQALALAWQAMLMWQEATTAAGEYGFTEDDLDSVMLDNPYPRGPHGHFGEGGMHGEHQGEGEGGGGGSGSGEGRAARGARGGGGGVRGQGARANARHRSDINEGGQGPRRHQSAEEEARQVARAEHEQARAERELEQMHSQTPTAKATAVRDESAFRPSAWHETTGGHAGDSLGEYHVYSGMNHVTMRAHADGSMRIEYDEGLTSRKGSERVNAKSSEEAHRSLLEHGIRDQEAHAFADMAAQDAQRYGGKATREQQARIKEVDDRRKALDRTYGKYSDRAAQDAVERVYQHYPELRTAVTDHLGGGEGTQLTPERVASRGRGMTEEGLARAREGLRQLSEISEWSLLHSPSVTREGTIRLFHGANEQNNAEGRNTWSERMRQGINRGTPFTSDYQLARSYGVRGLIVSAHVPVSAIMTWHGIRGRDIFNSENEYTTNRNIPIHDYQFIGREQQR